MKNNNDYIKVISDLKDVTITISCKDELHKNSINTIEDVVSKIKDYLLQTIDKEGELTLDESLSRIEEEGFAIISELDYLHNKEDELYMDILNMDNTLNKDVYYNKIGKEYVLDVVKKRIEDLDKRLDELYSEYKEVVGEDAIQ